MILLRLFILQPSIQIGRSGISEFLPWFLIFSTKFLISQNFEKFKYPKYQTDNYRVIFLVYPTRVISQTGNSFFQLENLYFFKLNCQITSDTNSSKFIGIETMDSCCSLQDILMMNDVTCKFIDFFFAFLIFCSWMPHILINYWLNSRFCQKKNDGRSVYTKYSIFRKMNVTSSMKCFISSFFDKFYSSKFI